MFFKRVLHDGDTAVINGDIDATNASSVLAEVLGDPPRPPEVLDMTGVTFLAAAGVHVVEALRKQAVESGGSLRVVGSPMVVRVLEACGVPL
jgi:anti-anti-sigma factor